MNTPLLKPLHCGISVADMQASIEWYENILGCQLVSRKAYEELNCEISFLELGDFQIELIRHHNTIPLPPERREPNRDIQIQGIKHVAYEVEDMAELFQGFKEKGVDVALGPLPMEGSFVGFIRDNTGNLIELIQRNL